MSEMLETYAETQELEAQESGPASWAIATVDAVHADGLSLIFPGESAAGGKHYKRNTSVTFTAGSLVLVIRTSGTYIAVCPVG